MNVLWETGAANVQTVQAHLQGRNLAYTTVQTMLNVLNRKGKVKRQLKDRAYMYRPVLSLFAAEDGTVHIRTVLELAFDLALAVEHVQHCLHRGIGQVAALEMRLHRLNVGGAGLPKHVHDLKLQGSERLFRILSSGHRVS